MKKKLLLLGDEAIAQAALDAGISGGYAYPGTPSTEILEYIRQAPETAERGIHHEWSSNEKTAMESALGMSYAGLRSLVCMKHVGLNVAADPFVNSAITGANGGLVIVVADDPSMHSSQNEQDSREYAKFAGIPCFEPSSQQEAYDMIHAAFELSEREKLPVLMRITTRLAHSRANITPCEPRPQNKQNLPEDPNRFVLLPANARKNYAELVVKQDQLLAQSETSPFNAMQDGSDTSMGIIACGIAANYLDECYAESPCPYPVLRIGQYPLPAQLIQAMAERCDSLLILEEGYPFLEERLAGPLTQSVTIKGRLTGALPRTGELDPDAVAKALGRTVPVTHTLPDWLRPRPPQLCKGCPHTSSYGFIKAILDAYSTARVFSDIGCYTLGALSPYCAIHTCVDMGASITMAKGASDAGLHPALAVIGDSTFTHSGMTGLLDCVHEGTRLVVLILDNDTTAMTGMQPSMASGRLEGICTGIGVDPAHLRLIDPMPKKVDENVAILREEIEYDGVSVIIARRPCIHVKRNI